MRKAVATAVAVLLVAGAMESVFGQTVWTRRVVRPDTISTVFFVNNLYVGTKSFDYMGGETSRIYTSTDGITWNKRAEEAGNDNYYISSVVWTGTQYVAASTNNDEYRVQNIVTSSDGISWNKRCLSAVGCFTKLVWANNQLVAVGRDANKNGIILTSADGVVWAVRARLSCGSMINACIWTGSKYVACGMGKNGDDVYNMVMTSTDGRTWSQPQSIGI